MCFIFSSHEQLLHSLCALRMHTVCFECVCVYIYIYMHAFCLFSSVIYYLLRISMKYGCGTQFVCGQVGCMCFLLQVSDAGGDCCK